MDEIDQMWQVCELEESNNASLSLFERFSVVSVPEKWIYLLEDGSLLCFWPSVDAARKIRSLHVPQDDEKCTYYKCRILLDGAKFSSYKKAKKAELIAQNVSSIMDSSDVLESHHAENICESTMDFTVSDAVMEDIDNNVDSVTAVDDDHVDDIVGNDSFEYNKAMLKWQPNFSKKAMAMAFKVEIIANEFLPRGIDETEFADNCDYSAEFNCRNFLTSTVIDEMDCSPSIKRVNVSDALLEVSRVELKISSFVNDILKDLNKSKEILRQIKNGSNEQERKETVSNKNATFIQTSFPQKDEAEFSNGNVELKVQPEKIAVLQPIVTHMDEVHYEDVSDDINIISETCMAQSVYVNDALNVQRPENHESDDIQDIIETSMAKSVHISDTLNVQRPEILSIRYIPCTQNVPVDVVPVSHVPAVPIVKNVPTNVVASVESEHQNAIEEPVSNIPSVPITINEPMDVVATKSQPQIAVKLPINSIERHKSNEDLLEDDNFEEALINHLVPLANENETTYMNRTILKVFTPNFLLDGVCWMKMPNRINIKNSYLVGCWMESFQKKYVTNDCTKTFQDHFRRLKSALRAAIKAESKRKLSGKPKKLRNKLPFAYTSPIVQCDNRII